MPSTMASTATATTPSLSIPTFCLPIVFQHLDLSALISFKRICRLWHSKIEQSQTWATFKLDPRTLYVFMKYCQHASTFKYCRALSLASIGTLVSTEAVLHFFDPIALPPSKSKFPYLHTVSLAHCARLTDESAPILLSIQPSLRILNIDGCSSITDIFVLYVAQCQKLEWLNISNCPLLTSSAFGILSLCTHLHTLIASACSQIRNEVFEYLRGFSALTTLDLSWCSALSGPGLSNYTTPRINLQRKEYESSFASSSSSSSWAIRFKDSINYCATQCNHDGAVKPQDCGWCTIKTFLGTSNLPNFTTNAKTLTTLDLSGCLSLTDDCLKPLQYMHELKSLSLRSCTLLTDQAIQNLSATSQNIAYLDISDCQMITSVEMEYWGQFSQLKSLLMYTRPNVNNTGLMNLLPLSATLSEFKISSAPSITDDGMKHISMLKSLTSLELIECEQVTDHGICDLVALSHSLRHLNISRCRGISDNSLSCISQLSLLTALDISWCNRITDRGIVQLQSLAKLTSLEMRWCAFCTSASLTTLSRNEMLTYLDVRYCPKISLIGLRKLQQYLPLLHPETNHVNPVTDDVMEIDEEEEADDEEKYGFFFLKVRKSEEGDSDERYSEVSDSKSQYRDEEDEDDLSSDYTATNSSESTDSTEDSAPSLKRRTIR